MTDTVLLDPTPEYRPAIRPQAARPAQLQGKRIALLDISKYRGDKFLDALQGYLQQAGLSVSRYMKPTYAKPAPVALQQEIAAAADLVVVALAD